MSSMGYCDPDTLTAVNAARMANTVERLSTMFLLVLGLLFESGRV
jgi:hypothetical protein